MAILMPGRKLRNLPMPLVNPREGQHLCRQCARFACASSHASNPKRMKRELMRAERPGSNGDSGSRHISKPSSTTHHLLRLAVLMFAILPFASAIANEESPVSLKLVSSAFEEGGAIPKKYTCEGQDISPPLAWSGVPQGAKSLVLIIDDPDAPDPKAPKMTWVHWVLYNLSANSTGLPEGVTSKALPAGTMVGLNDWKRASYGGPCPPTGRHRYFHKIYALNAVLSSLNQPNKAAVEAKMHPHILAQATLIGTYEKGR